MARPSLWHKPLRDFLRWLAAGDVSQHTITLRRYQLHRFAAAHQDRSPWRLTVDDIAEWLSGHNWARETRRSYTSAIRSFYGWAHAGGHIDHNPSRLLRRVPVSQHQPRPASEPTIDQALTAAAGTRLWLMLMLGSRQGLRRGEIARVHTDDLHRDAGGWSLLVHGKGGKQRIVPVLPEVAASILSVPPGYVFPSSTRPGQPISAPYCGKLISAALADAVPHQLRHRFATTAYQATHDLRAVQELLGHASVATTQRYVGVDTTAMRAAVTAAAA